MSASAQLRVYRFPAGAAFEGGVLGALERMELVGDTKLLDGLFVLREPAAGTVQAVDLGTRGGDNWFVVLSDFRLDPAKRSAITARTLASTAVPRPVIDAIAGTLEDGAAVLAVLYSGGAPGALEDAVARGGARLVADEDAGGARRLAEVAVRLDALAGPPHK